MSRHESRVVAVHAGGARESLSSLVAQRILAAIPGASEDGRHGQRLIPAVDYLTSICRALATDVPDDRLRRVQATLAAADGIVAVTPIVHGSYSGLFKSFIDLMGVPAFGGKAVLIAACGGSPRHCLALEHVVRPLFACLHSVVVPTAVFVARSDHGPGGFSAEIESRFGRAVSELIEPAALRRSALLAEARGA